MCISAPAQNTKLSHLICLKRFIASQNIIRAGKTTYTVNIKLVWDGLSQWKTNATSAKLELATVDCDDRWQAIRSRIFLLWILAEPARHQPSSISNFEPQKKPERLLKFFKGEIQFDLPKYKIKALERSQSVERMNWLNKTNTRNPTKSKEKMAECWDEIEEIYFKQMNHSYKPTQKSTNHVENVTTRKKKFKINQMILQQQKQIPENNQLQLPHDMDRLANHLTIIIDSKTFIHD